MHAHTLIITNEGQKNHWEMHKKGIWTVIFENVFSNPSNPLDKGTSVTVLVLLAK